MKKIKRLNALYLKFSSFSSIFQHDHSCKSVKSVARTITELQFSLLRTLALLEKEDPNIP